MLTTPRKHRTSRDFWPAPLRKRTMCEKALRLVPDSQIAAYSPVSHMIILVRWGSWSTRNAQESVSVIVRTRPLMSKHCSVVVQVGPLREDQHRCGRACGSRGSRTELGHVQRLRNSRSWPTRVAVDRLADGCGVEVGVSSSHRGSAPRPEPWGSGVSASSVIMTNGGRTRSPAA